MLSWHPNKISAEKQKREDDKDPEVENTYLELLDVPTHKTGLIAWLNIYFTEDNG